MNTRRIFPFYRKISSTMVLFRKKDMLHYDVNRLSNLKRKLKLKAMYQWVNKHHPTRADRAKVVFHPHNVMVG